jgi:hypothetical protein
MSDYAPPEQAYYGDYINYEQNHRYSYDSGLLALPVAGPTPAVKVIRIHGGVGFRTLDFGAARTGKPPVIPTMDDTPNDTFLGGTFDAALPVPNASSSSYDWAVTGEYTFVQLTPRVVGEDTFPVGGYPYPTVQQQYAATYISGGTAANPEALPIAEYDTFWNGVASNQTAVDITDGTFTWPFLAYPPVFTSDSIVSN